MNLPDTLHILITEDGDALPQQITGEAAFRSAKYLRHIGKPFRLLRIDMTDSNQPGAVSDVTDEVGGNRYIADPERSCGECGGKGRIKEYDYARSVMVMETCGQCGGSGARSVRIGSPDCRDEFEAEEASERRFQG